jgi:PAS domain S-box-containing protein
MVGLFGVFLLASHRLTYRRILKSIRTLQAGTAVIGSGNLDFVIKEKKNDEIGDLSHAFNQMASSLKEVTASKADLEREITERKQVEEELRRQREWLRVTLSSIGDAVIATDTEGRITFLNPMALTLTGWQPEETLGQPIHGVFRIINEKTHAPAEDLVARVLDEKRAIALANDTALVAKDGREVPIEDSAAPILDATGNLIGAVLVFHDVTAKRRTQEALREAHERAVWLARLPEENPNPVVRVSAEGSVLYCNPASVELPGWECKVDQPLHHPLLPLVGQAMAEGKEVQEDVQINGRSYVVWISPFPEEHYANVYGRDITSRKLAEEMIIRQNQIQEAINVIFQKSLSCDTEEELGRMCLAAAEELTGSKIGFIGEIGQDGWVHDIAISDPGWEMCSMYDKTGHRRPPGNFKIHGLYGRVLQDGKSLFVNDPASHPDSIGIPEGHPQLNAFLGVPFIQGDKVIGMAATGNREGGYTQEQQKDLEAVVPAIFEALLRKRAEVALRESEQRLNRAQEIAHLGSWELDLMSNRLTWSDEVYRIFGLQPQEFGATYEAFLEAMHPDDRAAVDVAYSGSLREGRDTYEIEHRVVRKSTGEIRTVQERCEHIRDASGGIIRSVGMVHDITERKQAEEALRQRTLELQQLTETLEQQVRERTEELEVANEELRKQVNECQRIEFDLRKSQTSLRHLSVELLNAQEKERKTIAGEIHDSIGSSLAAIKFKVDNAVTEVADKSPEATSTLKSLSPVIQGAIDEARRIQMNLRPSMLDDLGILATIRWFCRQFESTYSRIRISQDIKIEEHEVPDSLKTVIFRVLQEGLNNVAKHSQAKMVMLLLRRTGQGVQLVIRDNGQGFDLSKVQSPNHTAQGLGLKNMRERTELSGGSFVIESTLGKGTTIRASWPL